MPSPVKKVKNSRKSETNNSLRAYRQRKYKKQRSLKNETVFSVNNKKLEPHQVFDVNNISNPLCKISRKDYATQKRYIVKLEKILERMEPGTKPQIAVEQLDSIEIPVGMTICSNTETLEPNQTRYLDLEIIDPTEYSGTSLFSVEGLSSRFRTIGDGTMFQGKTISLQFSNWSDSPWKIEKGKVLAKARKILYQDLPKLESLSSENSGMIINNIDLKPSEQANEILDRKIFALRALSQPEYHEIADEFDKNREVFTPEDPGDKWKTIASTEVDYDLKSNAPSIISPNYHKRFNKDEMEAIDIFLRQGLSTGMIERVDSARFISPLLVVKKRVENGAKVKYRVLVDMRKVNDSALKKLAFHMPTMDEHIETFSGCSYFSTFDVRNAFHRIACSENTRDIACFIYNGTGEFQGLFRFTNLTQGASQSPMIFVNKIRQALAPILKDVNISFHVDDLLIGSTSLKQHVTDLTKFIRLAKRINLSLDIKKSTIATNDIEWCGFRFNQGLVSPAPSRLQALDTFVFPNIKDNKPVSKAYNRCFGYLQFFRKFVPKYTHMSAEMTKIVADAWDDTNVETFESAQSKCDKLTREICSKIKTQSLAIVSSDDDLILRTDASSLSYAFVLYRKSDRRPICFGGKSFNDTEKSYPPFCRELLGLKLGINKSLPYIHVAKSCLVESDNWVAVQNLNGRANELDCRALRLILEITTKSNDPKITCKHLPGIEIIVADTLSRLKFKEENHCSNFENEELHKINFLSQDNELFDVLNLRKIIVLTPRARKTLKDKILKLHDLTHSAVDSLYAAAKKEGLAGHGLFKLCSIVCLECSFCHNEKKILAHNILGKTETPKKELRTVHIDHMYMELSENKNMYLITLLDPFSKLFLALPVPSLEMEYVRITLQTFLLMFPSVTKIRGDRAFVSYKISELCDIFGIDLQFFASHNSRDNNVERYHKTYREKSTAFLLERSLDSDNWDMVNHLVVKAINSDINLATNMSPLEAVFHKNPSISDISQKTETAIRNRRNEIFNSLESKKNKRTNFDKIIPKLTPGTEIIIRYDSKSRGIPGVVIKDKNLTCTVKKLFCKNQHKILDIPKRYIWLPKSTEHFNYLKKLL